MTAGEYDCMNRPFVAAMRPCVKLLLPVVINIIKNIQWSLYYDCKLYCSVFLHPNSFLYCTLNITEMNI